STMRKMWMRIAMRQFVWLIPMLAGFWVQPVWAHNALMQAVETGNMAQVTALIADGANVNAKSTKGATPLFAAAITGYKGITALLIAHGADVNAKASNGVTPLIEAALNPVKECVL
ncbi:MAG: ankyrin repeat domain-containing protein, partial [Gammaproteobacteria bacterium]